MQQEFSSLSSTSFSLGNLANPSYFCEPLEISEQPIEWLLQKLEMMLLIRQVEQCLAQAKKDRIIGGPVHLGAGQEAIAVGISDSVGPADRVFGAHRSHAHVLALGSDVRALLAEVLGKQTGLSRGMGGSMHLIDKANSFYGSVPIVAGTVPLAVGAALAAKLQKSEAVAVAYLGDGAIEEGVVHESLNLARILHVPILFVIENNLFSSHMHISLRQPHDSTARFAKANDIPHEVVDGNDVLAVHSAASQLIAKSRNGEGPMFLEAITYRWYGHVDWREDVDVGVNRSAEDLAAWRKRDPVTRLSKALLSSELCNTETIDKIYEACRARVDSAWKQALKDPYPATDSLLNRVYN